MIHGEEDGQAASAISFLILSNRSCTSVSMTNGGDSWSHGAAPLPTSALTLTGSSRLLHSGRAGPKESDVLISVETDSPDASLEAGAKEANAPASASSHNHRTPGLKEHNYIGLSSDSYSSVHGGSVGASFERGECVKKNSDLESDEIELRLGLGLPESAKQECVRGDDVEIPVEGPPILTGKAASRICTSSNARKDVLLSSVEGVKVGIAEKCYPLSSNGLSRTYMDQDVVQRWDGNKSMDAGKLSLLQFSSCGLTKVADQRISADNGRRGNETSGEEMNQHLKDQTWSSHAISFPPSEISRQATTLKHETCGVHAITCGPAVQAKGCLDFQFGHQNPCSLIESSLDSALAAQKQWQAHTSPSLQGCRGAPNQDASKPGILELDTCKASAIQDNTGGFSGVRYAVPVPKCTIPAKRGFHEAIGPTVEPRAGFSGEHKTGCVNLRSNISVASSGCGISQSGTPGHVMRSSLDGDTTKPTKSQAAKNQPSHLSYLWNTPAGSWQMVPDQPFKAQVGSIAAKPRRAPTASPQPKVAAATVHGTETKTTSGLYDQHDINLVDDGGAIGRTPVVGWPPVRSFRKNTLALRSHPKTPSSEDQQVTIIPGSSSDSQPAASSTFYVKVNMDGVPIGRKVDLKTYDNYDGLKLALQDMFQRFVNGNNGTKEFKQLNLFQDTEYVLTHEDKDGDWMLVGDVPWQMFISTVKRLRIMKSCEATGLGGSKRKSINMQFECEGHKPKSLDNKC